MPGAPRSWKRQEGPSPGDSAGSMALGQLDLRRPVPRMGEDGLLLFKPPGLGSSPAVGTTGHSSTWMEWTKAS